LHALEVLGRSGFSRFGGAFNLGSDISAALQLRNRLMLIITLGNTYLGKSIRSSIAIDKKSVSLATVGIIYNF
tara:strand:+ start:4116 stop:4334 length:219 start_codon:yes stop_codon:yes gene_type:complete